MNALVVDDDSTSLILVKSILSQMGYHTCTARNGREALDVLHHETINLVITDWEMPEMNGIELCQQIRRQDFNGYVYVIMITGRDGGAEQKIEGLHAGADNFLTKPLNPAELLVCLKTAERILALETRDLAIFALAKLAESRDNETGAHIERVQSYTRVLAEQLASTNKYRGTIDGEYLRLIHQTSPLHDIGKVGIPDVILLKPGPLEESEMAVMRTHAELGARTLDAALQRFPNAKFLQMARSIALTHHEKFDGTGYPAGLSGEQIPLCGRIVALADVYDALTSRRVYKPAMPHQRAREIVISESGRHFDPEVVEAFVAREEDFLRIQNMLRDSEASSPRPQPVIVPERVLSAREQVMIVEDDPTQLKFLADLVASAGYDVLAADGGELALKLFRAHQPRIVISDLVMPGLDGIELCQRLRSDRPHAYTVFIMVTMRHEKEMMIRALDCGVDDFLSKPIDGEELLARLRASARVLRLHDELDRRNRSSAELNAQLSRLNSHLEQMAITDDLTGLCNRRSALAKLQEQIALAGRYGGPLAVALFDLDFFKQVNDTHGHDAGDEVLRQVAAAVTASVRSTDTVCRIGGEEFLIIFPAQSAAEAVVSAERCRRALAAQSYEFHGKQVHVTASFGVAGRETGMVESQELIQPADAALYAAKRQGRNRVCMAESAGAASGQAQESLAAS